MAESVRKRNGVSLRKMRDKLYRVEMQNAEFRGDVRLGKFIIEKKNAEIRDLEDLEQHKEKLIEMKEQQISLLENLERERQKLNEEQSEEIRRLSNALVAGKRNSRPKRRYGAAADVVLSAGDSRVTKVLLLMIAALAVLLIVLRATKHQSSSTQEEASQMISSVLLFNVSRMMEDEEANVTCSRLTLNVRVEDDIDWSVEMVKEERDVVFALLGDTQLSKMMGSARVLFRLLPDLKDADKIMSKTHFIAFNEKEFIRHPLMRLPLEDAMEFRCCNHTTDRFLATTIKISILERLPIK